MLSSEWQAKQDPDNAELKGDDDRFRYDGEFVASPKILGSWHAVALVQTLDEFNPGKPVNANRAPIKEITLEDMGQTNSGTMIWTGDTLMDLDRYQALKMTPASVAGIEYLIVEAGGFSEKNPTSWKSPLIVMKRK
jgi:hypothetical protein